MIPPLSEGKVLLVLENTKNLLQILESENETDYNEPFNF